MPYSLLTVCVLFFSWQKVTFTGYLWFLKNFIVVFVLYSQGQCGFLAKMVWEIPTIQEQKFVHHRGELCWYSFFFAQCLSQSEPDKETDWIRFFLFLRIYPGHYVPQLAELMLQFNKKENLFNLKGIAVSIFLKFQSFYFKTPLILY